MARAVMLSTNYLDFIRRITYSIRELITLQHFAFLSVCAARWRWRQCTPLELQIVLRPARPARPVGSDQQVLQTVAKTYPNCTLRTPAAPFLPSLAAPSPYFQLRDGLVCAWRWSAGPHMTQGHGIRLFHDHACPIGVGYSHSSPFPSFPTWPHCDRFFVQVKWS